MKRYIRMFLGFLTVCMLLSGCNKEKVEKEAGSEKNQLLGMESQEELYRETDYLELPIRKEDGGSKFLAGSNSYKADCMYSIESYQKEDDRYHKLTRFSYLDKDINCWTVDISEQPFTYGYFAGLDAKGKGEQYALFLEMDTTFQKIDKYWCVKLGIDAVIKSAVALEMPVWDERPSAFGYGEDGKIVLVNSEGTGQAVFDKKGALLEEAIYSLPEYAKDAEQIFSVEGAERYYTTWRGLQRHNGEQEELLVSLKGAGIANVSGVSVMSDSLILLWGGDADKVEVYAITPITQEEMQEREEIVIADIAGKGQSELVKAAAAAFSRTNENTKIVYESDKDAEAYRTRIMADVMNGGGPDMLWVTREDMDLLQEKGALLELSKMLSEDIKEQIWPAVLELGTVEGQYVGIAPEVNIHAFMVSKEILQSPEWSWEKFLTVAQKIQPALTVSIGETLPKPEGSIRTLLFPNLENFGLVNMDERSCHFDSEEFKEFLKQCKKNLSMGKELDIAGMLQSGECLVSSQSITGIYQYDLIQSQFEESCEYVDNGYIDSEAFLVVNKKTTDTDTISAFVEHLLSMENQMNRVNDNRIREDAVRNSIEMWEMDDGTIMLLSASEGYGGAVLSIREDGSNRVEEYIAFLRNCKAYPRQNKVINRIIEEEVNAYFYGNRSVDAVTENIQNRVELYLEE